MDEEPPPTPPRPLREATLVYLSVGVLTFGITRLKEVEALADYVHLAVAALFLLPALRLAQREPDGPRRYGIDLAGILGPPSEDVNPGPFGLFDLFRALRRALPSAGREALVALAVVAVVFPPFGVGFYFFHGPSHPFAFNPPDDLASFALAQLLVVALPEEALFRGYFQTRLADAWPRTVRILGADVPVAAWVTQAALFAVVHFVVDLDPQRLAVFFPGLLFGWLRSLRGGMGAAIAVHALSNVYSELLVRGWLS